MRKTKGTRMEWFVMRAVFAVFLVLLLGMLTDHFSLVTQAAGKGKVTATAAKIRKETDVNSEVLGSVAQGKVIDIKSEVKDGAGTVWYEVYVNGETTGYIRSDLVEKTDGSAPSAEPPSTTPPAMNPTVEVTAVEPLSATITGSDTVRVRADASTNGAIITTVKSGVAVTVNGQATGTDGNTWYQVGFNSEGSDVEGFVREDYLTLSGEVVPAGEGTPEGGGTEGGDQPQEEPTQPTKDYDTQQQDGVWYLLDYGAGEQYDINQLITSAKSNYDSYQASLGTIKIQKIVIIVMVVLLVLAVLAATLLFFKVRDINDEAYFTAVEKETIRERGKGGKPDGTPSRRVMQTVGSEGTKSSLTGKSAKPMGQKPQPVSGKASAAQSQARPIGGAKPVSGSGQPRPSAGSGMPQSRPSAGASQSRPAGSSLPRQSGASAAAQSRQAGASAAAQSRQAGASTAAQSRQSGPAGVSRPAGTSQPGSAVRPAASGQPRPSAPGRTSGSQPGTAPRSTAQPRPVTSAGQPGASRPAGQKSRPAQQDPAWKSKNFMTDDDDEFEFEFLNWDDDDNI